MHQPIDEVLPRPIGSRALVKNNADNRYEVGEQVTIMEKGFFLGIVPVYVVQNATGIVQGLEEEDIADLVD